MRVMVSVVWVVESGDARGHDVIGTFASKATATYAYPDRQWREEAGVLLSAPTDPDHEGKWLTATPFVINNLKVCGKCGDLLPLAMRPFMGTWLCLTCKKVEALHASVM